MLNWIVVCGSNWKFIVNNVSLRVFTVYKLIINGKPWNRFTIRKFWIRITIIVIHPIENSFQFHFVICWLQCHFKWCKLFYFHVVFDGKNICSIMKFYRHMTEYYKRWLKIYILTHFKSYFTTIVCDKLKSQLNKNRNCHFNDDDLKTKCLIGVN